MSRYRAFRRRALASLSLLPLVLAAGASWGGPPRDAGGVPAQAADPGAACRLSLLVPDIVPEKAIDAGTLSQIRDIGNSFDDGVASPPLALSPDRRHVAFAMRRGEPARNITCTGIFTLDLVPGAKPKLVALAGEPLIATGEFAGLAAFPNGTILTTVPRWSPDGQSIAFLKRSDGHTQVWRVRASGGEPRIAASRDADIDDFAWSPDGSKLVVSSNPGLTAADRAIDREAEHGYLYDDRAFPMGSARPFPLSGPSPVVETIDLRTGEASPAGPAETAWLRPRPDGVPSNARNVAVGSAGDSAWQSQSGENGMEGAVLTARLHGRDIVCDKPLCHGTLSGPWWSQDGRSLVFARRGAEQAGLTRYYDWAPARGTVRLLRAEDARYVSCRPVTGGEICLREDPATPFQIVSLDVETGRYRTLFDPNPEISGQFKGTIERLSWQAPGGTPTFGHLVLPPGYHTGQILPLVVVQYRASGFQRGGVGDEMPILPLANDGFAVLNFERPDWPGNYPTGTAYMRAAMQNWQDERQALAALEAGVHLLIDRGIVDPERIGIYGLSAGSQTAQFALLHSPLFRAVSFGTCCKDPYPFMIETGPGYRHLLEDWGLGPIESGNEAQWRDVSLAMNASRIDAAILMQLPEWEFRGALDTVTALRSLHKPVELDVFAGEYHIKTQPAHRLAIYQRNIDWFDYWLRDRKNMADLKGDQYTRWDQLKAQARVRTP